MVERALQVTEADVRIHRQSFDLVEHGRVARVRRIVCGVPCRNHDADRGFIFSMVRICTGEVWVPQQQPLALRLRFLPGDEQRILRVACRMVGGEISALKVV